MAMPLSRLARVRAKLSQPAADQLLLDFRRAGTTLPDCVRYARADAVTCATRIAPWGGPGGMAARNRIRNSKLVGAGPDRLPDLWAGPTNASGTVTVNGITIRPLGLVVQDGKTCLAIQYSGTATAGTATSIQVDNTGTTHRTVPGQSWAFTMLASLRSGSIPGGGMWMSTIYRDAAGGYSSEGGNNVASQLVRGAPLKRIQPVGNMVAPAACRFVQPYFYLSIQQGETVDCTLLLSEPQLEPGTAFSGLHVPTEPSAYCTRIELVPANVPRIDYDPDTLQPLGLRIEEAHTNVQPNGRTAWTLSYNPSGVTQSVGPVAPDGTTNWTRIDIPAANCPFNFAITPAGTTAGGWNVQSFFIRVGAGMPPTFTVYGGNATSTGGQQFTLAQSNGKVTGVTGAGSNVGIVRDFGDCQQVTLIYQATLDIVGASLTIGVNATSTGPAEMWLWQRQQGQGRGEYAPIFTDGTAKTRAADLVDLYLPESIKPDLAITVAGEWRGGRESSQGDYGRLLGPWGSATFMARDGGAFVSVWNGSTNVRQGINTDPADAFVKTVASQRADVPGGRRFVAGPGGSGSASGLVQPWTRPIGVGRNQGNNGLSLSGNFLNGHVRWLKFWNRCLPDAEALQAIA